MKKYETFYRGSNGKWFFSGWYPMQNEEFCIDTKIRGKYIYKTYKWLNGTIEEVRYGESFEV